MNRIHKIENLSKKPITRILCSDRLKVLRLLSMKDLDSCQEHRTEPLYLCSGREIMISFNQMTDCNNLQKLPTTLVVELNDNHFLIDRTDKETINIFCNDSLHHTISAGTSSTIISLPNECNIISKTIKVSKLENDHHNVTFTVNNEFKIFPIKINPWRPFHREIIDNIIIDNDPIDLFPKEIQEQIDQMIKQTNNEVKSLEPEYSGLGIGSISISSSVLFLVLMALLVFFIKNKCLNHSYKNRDNSLETKDLKQDIEALKSKTKDLEEKFVDHYKTSINNMETNINSVGNKVEKMISKSSETHEQFLELTNKLHKIEALYKEGGNEII